MKHKVVFYWAINLTTFPANNIVNNKKQFIISIFVNIIRLSWNTFLGIVECVRSQPIHNGKIYLGNIGRCDYDIIYKSLIGKITRIINSADLYIVRDTRTDTRRDEVHVKELIWELYVTTHADWRTRDNYQLVSHWHGGVTGSESDLDNWEGEEE